MLQYYHRSIGFDTNNHLFTVALDPPTKARLLDFTNPAPIVFDLGVAHCSDEDQYMKDIGREVARRAIRIGKFKIKSIVDEGVYYRFGLIPFNKLDQEIVFLEFKVFKHGGCVHFVFAEVNKI